MRIKRLTLSILMLAVISPDLFFGRSLGQSGGRRIKIEKVWGGEIKLELQQQAPQNRFIANEKAWAQLWRAYRGNDELPQIDFDKQMILVGFSVDADPGFFVGDPGALTLGVDEKEDLKFPLFCVLTTVRREVCRYIFLLISREGVKSINGNPIE